MRVPEGGSKRTARFAALAILIAECAVGCAALLAPCGAGAEGPVTRFVLPPGTLAVKVESGYVAVQDGERSLRLYDLAQPQSQGRAIDLRPQDLGVVSLSLIDFSVSPDAVLTVALYANFGLGDSRYALARYPLRETGAPQLLRLPDVRCRHLGAGVHGVWCLDPDPRESRAEPPTLTWIDFLGKVRRYILLREPGVSLGPPRVVVGPGDVARAWLPEMRTYVEAEPLGGVTAQTPIPVDPVRRALTSFAAAPDGRVWALFPLRSGGEEMLTTPYALVELDTARRSWRKVNPERRCERGAQLAGWSEERLWVWKRRERGLETLAGNGID